MGKMKAILAILLSLALLAGCGGSSGGSSTQESQAPAQEQQSDSQPEPSVQGERFKVGIYQHVDHPSLDMIREAIVDRLGELGYNDSNVDFDLKSAQGDASALGTISQTFVGDEKDVIVAIATNTAQSAAAATEEIPIVFAAVADPVAARLVDSMDENPTGNVTGTSHQVPVEDIFNLAERVTPGISTYGLVYNAGEVSAVSTIDSVKAYFDSIGMNYVEATIANTSELQQATLSLVGQVDAIFVPNDNSIASAMQVLAEAAADNGIPVYCSADTMVEDGGLATIGVDFVQLGRQTGDMIAKILEGTPITEIQPEKFTDFTTMINLDTAAKLGLDVSDMEGVVFVSAQ